MHKILEIKGTLCKLEKMVTCTVTVTCCGQIAALICSQEHQVHHLTRLWLFQPLVCQARQPVPLQSPFFLTDSILLLMLN